MNQEDRSKPHTMNVCGALVYPTVDEDFDFSYRYKETGHRIFVRTVNLGQPWRKIEERVKEIVKREKAGMNGEEGQAMRDKLWNSLERG